MSVRSRIKEFEALAQANDGSNEKRNEASKYEILHEYLSWPNLSILNNCSFQQRSYTYSHLLVNLSIPWVEGEGYDVVTKIFDV